MESSASRVAGSPRPHVVLLASPGVGHLNPLAELARRLALHHGLAATLVTFTYPAAHSAIFSSLRAADVAVVSLDDLRADAPFKTDFPDQIRRSIPNLRALLHSVSSTAPLAALVPDFFCYEALPLATELGVPAYIFYPTNLSALAIMHRTVALHDGAAAGEYRGLPDPLQLSRRVSLRRADIPSRFRDSASPHYALIIDMGRRFRAAAGFLVNSFYEMENASEEEIKLAAEREGFPPAYPVGPLLRPGTDESSTPACLEWLDRQPTGSVVFVSFGSGGALSVEQTAELAAGLESSGHRFLWVVRTPSLDGVSLHMGTNDGDDKEDPLAWLPDGFVQRTSGRGLTVATWAPQVRVLSHPATASFVSHCGWNSTLESMAAGVPMIAWPLYAEQTMNAVILSEAVGVALRPRERADGLVAREEIAAAVAELMEGEKGRSVRGRARELQQAAAQAWEPEGSSSRTLEKVVGEWKVAAAGRWKQ